MNNEGINLEMGSASSQRITRENRKEFDFMWRKIKEGVWAKGPIVDHDIFEAAIDDLILRHPNDLFDLFLRKRETVIEEVRSLMAGQEDIEHKDTTHHDDDHHEADHGVAA